jgi:hypothetical protein
MSELPPNQCSIQSADADLGRRQPAAHEASGAQTFGGTSRRKRNVARKILLKSQHRLLWLWPQYFPKHDVVTGRLKTDLIDRIEGERELAEAELLEEHKIQPGDYWSDPGWRKAGGSWRRSSFRWSRLGDQETRRALERSAGSSFVA